MADLPRRMPRGSEARKQDWVDVLDRAGIAYVMVGGYAAELHGATRFTLDIDVVPRWDEANLRRLCDLLRSVNAETVSGPKATGDQITPALLQDREILNWNTSLGQIDTLVGIPNADGEPVDFDQLLGRARAAQLGDVTVAVANLNDIITSKEYAGREKDHQALPELRRIEEEQRSGEGE